MRGVPFCSKSNDTVYTCIYTATGNQPTMLVGRSTMAPEVIKR